MSTIFEEEDDDPGGGDEETARGEGRRSGDDQHGSKIVVGEGTKLLGGAAGDGSNGKYKSYIGVIDNVDVKCDGSSTTEGMSIESDDDLKDGGDSDGDSDTGNGDVTLWAKYNAALERRPLLVKMTTAVVIMALGDALGQFVECVHQRQCLHFYDDGSGAGVEDTDSESFDWLRTVRFGALGAIGTPWAHFYYRYLDESMPPTVDRPCSLTTFKKLFVDQFVQAPAMLVTMVFALSFLAGRGLSGFVADMRSNYWDTCVAQWKLWIPASFVNLAVVRPTLRVLFINVVCFFWMIALSILLNRH